MVVPVPADVHTPLHLAEACFVTSVQLLSDFSTLVLSHIVEILSEKFLRSKI